MSGPTQGGNAYAETVATQADGLPLDALALIGVFGTVAARRALVRHASGRVQKVELGARVAGATVVAISPDSLMLKSGGSTRVLEMPAG